MPQTSTVNRAGGFTFNRLNLQTEVNKLIKELSKEPDKNQISRLINNFLKTHQKDQFLKSIKIKFLLRIQNEIKNTSGNIRKNLETALKIANKICSGGGYIFTRDNLQKKADNLADKIFNKAFDIKKAKARITGFLRDCQGDKDFGEIKRKLALRLEKRIEKVKDNLTEALGEFKKVIYKYKPQPKAVPRIRPKRKRRFRKTRKTQITETQSPKPTEVKTAPNNFASVKKPPKENKSELGKIIEEENKTRDYISVLKEKIANTSVIRNKAQKKSDRLAVQAAEEKLRKLEIEVKEARRRHTQAIDKKRKTIK